MNAYDLAKQIYGDFPDRNLDNDIREYITNHYCYFSPEAIILAKVEGDSWFVHLAVGKGSLLRFFKVAPFELSFVQFARPKKKRLEVKMYTWFKLKKLCERQT